MDSVPPIFPRPPITDLRESRVHDRSSQTLLAYHYTLGLKKKKDFPSRTNSGKQVVSCPRAVAPIPIYVTANQNDANFRLWFESWKRILHINLMTGAELTSLWSPYAVWFEERDIHSWIGLDIVLGYTHLGIPLGRPKWFLGMNLLPKCWVWV